MTPDKTIVSSTEALAQANVPIVGGGEVLGMGISMLVVVAVILLLGWLYSRSRAVANGGASGVINIIASRALGPKERLLVVEVADQQLLIGMTATGVRTLHVFDAPIAVDDESAANRGFAARLKTAVQEFSK